jgi:hypothetical protein
LILLVVFLGVVYVVKAMMRVDICVNGETSERWIGGAD